MSASDLVARLAKEGIDPSLLAEVAQELFAGEIERKSLAERRQNERTRKANQRIKSRDVTGHNGTARDVTGPPNEYISNPQPVSDETVLATQRKSKKGTRLADDFQAPEDWIAWAVEKRGWSREDATDEAECFARYWQAKPGREACKLDWPKTWQNWVTNSRRADRRGADPPSFLENYRNEQRRLAGARQ